MDTKRAIGKLDGRQCCHIISVLRASGKAVAVVPDSVLFEAAAGEVVRGRLLETTLLTSDL